MNPDRCDPEVFYRGSVLMGFDATTAEANRWVSALAEESGQRVDWHYLGGMACVRYLGSQDAVIGAVDKLLPTLAGRVLFVRRP
ncbi:hypothetical protein [Polyangium mundeleinium]|uniref:Uncharacterized protein n=1 Tax=Polyangium mundeleinium TaxID=2995306 RepID=A0ABT5EXX4_9BACT|nr:hypothetical protein [Polyangium mundeleinium]MDC0746676.1 hypothetical protein [Polyangium mundeleinium]